MWFDLLLVIIGIGLLTGPTSALYRVAKEKLRCRD